MKVVTVSSKRQVTIPKRLLNILNVEPGSKLVLKVQKDLLIAQPLGTSVVEQTAGSLTASVSRSRFGVPFPQALKKTKQIVAKDLAR